MARGPKPAPTALRLLRGDRPSRINHAEPIAPVGNTEPPSWLEGAALEKWRELVPLLQKMNLLTDADRDGVGRYCIAFERYVHALGICRKGLDVMHHKGPNGRIVSSQVSPFASLLRRYADAMDRAAAEFGLTPSARSRIVGTAACRYSSASKRRRLRASRAGTPFATSRDAAVEIVIDPTLGLTFTLQSDAAAGFNWPAGGYLSIAFVADTCRWTKLMLPGGRWARRIDYLAIRHIALLTPPLPRIACHDTAPLALRRTSRGRPLAPRSGCDPDRDRVRGRGHDRPLTGTAPRPNHRLARSALTGQLRPARRRAQHRSDRRRLCRDQSRLGEERFRPEPLEQHRTTCFWPTLAHGVFTMATATPDTISTHRGRSMAGEIVHRRFAPAGAAVEVSPTRGGSRSSIATITGYAACFNETSHDLGGFREIIRPRAFTAALRSPMTPFPNPEPASS